MSDSDYFHVHVLSLPATGLNAHAPSVGGRAVGGAYLSRLCDARQSSKMMGPGLTRQRETVFLLFLLVAATGKSTAHVLATILYAYANIMCSYAGIY